MQIWYCADLECAAPANCAQRPPCAALGTAAELFALPATGDVQGMWQIRPRQMRMLALGNPHKLEMSSCTCEKCIVYGVASLGMMRSFGQLHNK